MPTTTTANITNLQDKVIGPARLTLKDDVLAIKSSYHVEAGAPGMNDTYNSPKLPGVTAFGLTQGVDMVSEVMVDSNVAIAATEVGVSVELTNKMLRTVKRDEFLRNAGKAILNLQDSPELEAVRIQWMNYYNAEKMEVPERLAGFATAVAQAHTAVRRFERAAAREDAKKAKTTAAQRTKKALEEAGVHDLDTGAGSAGQHVTVENIDTLFNEGHYSPAKYRHFLDTGVIRQ